MLSREEAIGETEAALCALKLTGPLTPTEMHQFCQKLTARLLFKSESGRLEDIRCWAENWQDFWLRSSDTASPHSLAGRENVKFPTSVIYRAARNALAGIVDQAVAELRRVPNTLQHPSSPATYKSIAALKLLLGSLPAAWNCTVAFFGGHNPGEHIGGSIDRVTGEVETTSQWIDPEHRIALERLIEEARRGGVFPRDLEFALDDTLIALRTHEAMRPAL